MNKKEKKICNTSGKVCHTTEEDAKRAVKEDWLINMNDKVFDLRVYFCLYCDSFHLTSKKY